MSENKGLFGKYIIEKADGSPIPEEARYFVLRYDKDPAALEALKTYQRAINNISLKQDLAIEIYTYDTH